MMNKEITNYANTLQFRTNQGEKYFLDILAGKTSADERLLSEHSNRKSTGAAHFRALAEDAARKGYKQLMVREFESIYAEEPVAVKSFSLSKARTKKAPEAQEKQAVKPAVAEKQVTTPVQPESVPAAFAGFGSIEGFYGGLQGFLGDKTTINTLQSDLRFAEREIQYLGKQLETAEKRVEQLSGKNDQLDSQLREKENDISQLRSKIGWGQMVSQTLSGIAVRHPKLRHALDGLLDGLDAPESIEGQSNPSYNYTTNPAPSASPDDQELKSQFVQAVADFVRGVAKDDLVKLYKVINFCTASKDNLNVIHDLCQQPVNQA